MNRLHSELRRVLGDPPVAPRAVVRVEVGAGQGLEEGRAEADRLVDAGAELVVLDAAGVTPSVLAVLAVLLDLEPVAVVGTTPTEQWRDLVLAVRTCARDLRPALGDPAALVGALEDPALTRTTGLLERLADRRTPVLVGGGATAAAAALLASRLLPGAERWWLAGSVPTHEAAARAWRSLGLEPLLDLGLTEGSADVAVSVVRAGLEQLGA